MFLFRLGVFELWDIGKFGVILDLGRGRLSVRDEFKVCFWVGLSFVIMFSLLKPLGYLFGSFV